MKILKKILLLFKRQEKINYEVWGSDTFSHEYYLCDTYSTRDDAEKALEVKQESAMRTQGASLRNDYWIVEITDEKILERQEREHRIWKEKYDELSYSARHLTDCIRKLLQLFKSSWETANLETLCKENDRKLMQKVLWENEADCFNQVHFETHYYPEEEILKIGVGVAVRSGKYYGGSTTRMSQFSGTLAETLEWAGTEKALDDCVNVIENIISEWDD